MPTITFPNVINADKSKNKYLDKKLTPIISNEIVGFLLRKIGEVASKLHQNMRKKRKKQVLIFFIVNLPQK